MFRTIVSFPDCRRKMVQRVCMSMIPRGRGYASFARLAASLKASTENLTGHSEVLEAQKLVRTRREELQNGRERLSETAARYGAVQDKLKSLYARKTQVYQNQRRDVSALLAVNTEEEQLLYEEQTLHESLEACQGAERECFEGLSDAIVESHEKERAQSDRMKYYSRLGSLIGAIFGFLGSNLFLRRDIREHGRSLEERINQLMVSVGELEPGRGTSQLGAQQVHRLDAMTLEMQNQTKLVGEIHQRLAQTQTHNGMPEAGVSADLRLHRLLSGETQDSRDAGKQFSSSDVLVIGLSLFSVLVALLASNGCR